MKNFDDEKEKICKISDKLRDLNFDIYFQFYF